MADATDSKSVVRKDVWVQVPPPVLSKAEHRVGFAIGRPLGAVRKVTRAVNAAARVCQSRKSCA